MQDSDFFSTDWFYTGPDLWPVTFGTTTLNDSYSTDAEDDHLEWAWDLVKD